MKMKDHGWLCTACVVWSIVLRAAARTCSLCAACRDLSNGPSDQAVLNALTDGLPKTLRVLETRLNAALVDPLPHRLQKRRWPVAIDWHLVPYYGEPERSRNEIFYGKPRQGTKKFHAYATACILSQGTRYTLAVTWVRRHETTVVALRRLLAWIREKGLKIRRVLLDRAFFNTPVTRFLQDEQLPFLMPVMFRGRTVKNKKKKRNPTGLQWIKRQKAGWYSHTLKNKTQTASISICVAYRTHKNRKDGKRKQQKLLFGAWRVHGFPTEIRDLYRTRFGIETSYRQWRQARIFTCTRDPHLRLLFVVIGLLLRNVWVWIHETLLAEGRGESLILHLEKLRFRRLLDWIAFEVVAQLHDGSAPCVEFSN
jgi:hypothetical protein